MLAVRRVTLALMTVFLALPGCGGDSPRPAGEAVRDTLAETPADPRVVVIRAAALRLEPDYAAPAIVDVPAGALLAVPSDEPARDGAWVRVATWDDRRGWLPASDVVDAGLWGHYGAAFGGVSPILLRPAYPVEGGRWGVEAPFHSPGLTAASSVWLLGDSTSMVRIARIDSIENVCGDDRHRFATTERTVAAVRWPFLDAGVIAAPSGSRPGARPLTVARLEAEPALVDLAETAAAELAPAGAGPPGAVEWAALGEGVAWAAFSWAAEDVDTGQAQLAAAALFVRGPGGWTAAGMIPLTPSSAVIPTPAWRPIAVYATDGAIRPTVLLLEALEYEGAHLDIWIERGGHYVRLYHGYYWGC